MSYNIYCSGSLLLIHIFYSDKNFSPTKDSQTIPFVTNDPNTYFL